MPYAYQNVAVVYANWGRQDLALHFARKAKQAAENCGDQITYAIVLSVVGSLLGKAQLYSEAIEAVSRSISITQDVLHYYYSNLDVLAFSYCMLGQVDSSEFYLSKMEAYTNAGHAVRTSLFYTTKGFILALNGKYSNAIPFLEKAIDLKKSAEREIDSESITIYQRLSEAYQKGPKNYQKALYYKQMQYNLADSIHKKSHSEAMAEFGVKYEATEKELEITQLNLQQEHMKTEKVRIVIWLVVIIALFLGALLYSMILRQKKRTEKILLNQKLEEKEREFDTLASDMEMRQVKSYLDGLEAERTRLAGELHDNVSNALLGVEFKMRVPGTSQEEVSGMLRGIHEHVRNISHELMPPVFQHATLAEIIADYVYMQNGMSGPHFECRIDPEDGWEDLPLETALELHRIVQEACGNALKHSGAPLISITLQRNGNRVTLMVKDYGRGLYVDSKKSGWGLQIIHDRAAKMNGLAEIVSAVGKGTTITVTV